MEKCIVKVIYKDGQSDLIQVDYTNSDGYTLYNAFNLYSGFTHKIEEIVFVRMCEKY